MLSRGLRRSVVARVSAAGRRSLQTSATWLGSFSGDEVGSCPRPRSFAPRTRQVRRRFRLASWVEPADHPESRPWWVSELHAPLGHDSLRVRISKPLVVARESGSARRNEAPCWSCFAVRRANPSSPCIRWRWLTIPYSCPKLPAGRHAVSCFLESRCVWLPSASALVLVATGSA